ncbi:hypothetical protein B5F96_02230 [Parabacteroides johnsonii]|uniref:Uncharacterized protein n=1 Tax=Parabacteroides johnsonii TaxID=387661 RepID=A0A9Q5XA83_9BACT|nr:hypothetical protein B5F96_02230 [Parabacteroides johnsonii]
MKGERYKQKKLRRWKRFRSFFFPKFLQKYSYKMLKMLQLTEKITYFASLIVCRSTEKIGTLAH